MKRVVLSFVTLAWLAAGTAWAQNPCNPCAGKADKMTHKPAVNPCHAKKGMVFHVADPMQRNTVSFESQAPLEDILGTTNQITGYLVMDPMNVQKGVWGEFVVPVASLDTGIPLRDEHLRNAMWLDAEKYPNIVFTIRSAKNVNLVRKSDQFRTYELDIVGNLELHGQRKQVTVPARVTYLVASEQTKQKLPGNLVAARGEFSVALSDFGVQGMKGVVGSKVSETIDVKISFTGTTHAPEMAMNPCNPCGGKQKRAANPCNPCGSK